MQPPIEDVFILCETTVAESVLAFALLALIFIAFDGVIIANLTLN